jgi:hypothetical protein
MRETMPVPIDEETRLPALILPTLGGVGEQSARNYHHHFFNAHDPHLLGKPGSPRDTLEALAGRAVRMSRGQVLPVPVHTRFHDDYEPLGDQLPHTVDEKFKTAVRACTGVASRWAIDLSRPADDRLVYMSDEVFAKVADPAVLCPEDGYYDARKHTHGRSVTMADFFVRYALSRELTMVSERVIDEFLYSPIVDRRRKLGNFILAEALNASVDGVAGEYRQLRKRGMVHKRTHSVYSAIHNRVRVRGLARYHGLLEDSLLAAA